MRMGEIEIHDYARQLLDAHGEMAVVEAAQKARTFEEKGQTEEAETWRGIEAASLLSGLNDRHLAMGFKQLSGIVMNFDLCHSHDAVLLSLETT